MRITLPYVFTAQITPPRCRKPRPVFQQATLRLSIPEVSAQ